MNREDCYMTFSEALESYLQARESTRHFGEGHNRRCAQEDMRVAAEHMDALTAEAVKENGK
jgi:hypothetical protein